MPVNKIKTHKTQQQLNHDKKQQTHTQTHKQQHTKQTITPTTTQHLDRVLYTSVMSVLSYVFLETIQHIPI
jgi:hypothetical protein